MKKKISVIIPIFNKEKTIAKCVDSILSQSYENIELILVDDGSADDSFRICQRYESDNSNVILIHQKNSGVSAARNIGLSRATGDYITFVDADDWIDNQMFSEMISLIEGSSADICASYFYYDKNGVEVIPKNACLYDNAVVLDAVDICKEISKIYDRKIGWEVCSKIFKRDILQGITFDTTIYNGEDWLFFCKVLRNAKNMVVTPKKYYHYVYQEQSASKSFRFSYISASEASEIVLELGLPFSKDGLNNIKEGIAQNAALCKHMWKSQKITDIDAERKAIGYIKKYFWSVIFNKDSTIKRKAKFLRNTIM